MDSELEFARLVALSAVCALGDRAPDWKDVRVHYYDDNTHDFTLNRTETVHVSLRSVSGTYKDEAVYFGPSGENLALAVIMTVDGIQDHAVESSWGEPLPPCPGHVHPLAPRVVEGVPKWVCMNEGASHYELDILPNFDPDFSTPEEYLLLSGHSG